MVRDIANPNRVNLRISVLPTRPFPGRRRDLVHSAQTGRVRRAGSCTRRRFDLRCSLARNLKTRPYDWPHVDALQTRIGSTSESWPHRPGVSQPMTRSGPFGANRAGQAGQVPAPDMVSICVIPWQEMSRPAPTIGWYGGISNPGLTDPPYSSVGDDAMMFHSSTMMEGRVRRTESSARGGFGSRCSRARSVKTRSYDWPQMVSWSIQIDWTSNLSLGTPRFARDFLFAP